MSDLHLEQFRLPGKRKRLHYGLTRVRLTTDHEEWLWFEPDLRDDRRLEEYEPGTIQAFCEEHGLLVATERLHGTVHAVIAPTLHEATIFKLRFSIEPPILKLPVPRG